MPACTTSLAERIWYLMPLSRRPDFLTALKHATEDGYPLAFCNSVTSVESSLLSRLAVTQERDSRWGEYAHLAAFEKWAVVVSRSRTSKSYLSWRESLGTRNYDSRHPDHVP